MSNTDVEETPDRLLEKEHEELMRTLTQRGFFRRAEQAKERFFHFLIEFLLCVKNKVFAQEEEWRLIQIAPHTADVKFRARGSQLIPYVVLDLTQAEGEHKDKLPITSIKHGPTFNESSHIRRTLDRIIKAHGYDFVEIRGPGYGLRT